LLERHEQVGRDFRAALACGCQRREGYEVEIGARLRMAADPRGPAAAAERVLLVEAGDERALVIEVASGRVREQRLAGLAVTGGKFGVRAAEDGARGAREPAKRAPGPDDGGCCPGQRSCHPPVIYRRAGLVEHDVL